MLPGTNPYIGSSEFKNGVTAYVGNPVQFPGNVITVPYNGSVGFAAYQPDPFLAGDDVHVLLPRQEMTVEAMLAVCTVIRLERYRFSYGRKWHLGRMKESVIRLPKTADGDPDWDALTEFMRGLPFSAGLAVTA